MNPSIPTDPKDIAEKVAAARELLKTVKDNIELLPSEDRRMIMELMDSEIRPKNWRGASVATYYKREYAVWLLRLLDERIIPTERKTDYRIEARLFRLSPKSLTQRITQAWLYIMDYMDTEDGKYKTLRQEIAVCKEREYVRFAWRDAFRYRSEEIVGEEVQPRGKNPEWQKVLEEWLEDEASTTTLTIGDIKLDDRDIKYVREMLSMFSNVKELKLSASCISLLKIPESIGE